MQTITVIKPAYSSIWTWCFTNHFGGGSGSHAATRRSAISAALRLVDAGPVIVRRERLTDTGRSLVVDERTFSDAAAVAAKFVR